jgi:hypothetical protein
VNKIIHHITVAYLAFIILIRMMAMPISLADYSLNKKFISANLCENRLNPEMHCAGKCYLKKQLAKTNDTPSSQDQKGTPRQILTDFFEPIDKPDFRFSAVIVAYSAQVQAERIPSRFTGNIFRPPII